MGDTPHIPRRIALATLSWLSPIRRPRLWKTLIGAIRLGGRPHGAGTAKSEHLRQIRSDFRYWVLAYTTTSLLVGAVDDSRNMSQRVNSSGLVILSCPDDAIL